MGDLNQYGFVKKNREIFSGPVLEIGARRYNDVPPLRALFAGEEWLGVDQKAGEGVDVVVDLTLPFDDVDAALGGKRFETIFCLSVLEHCEQPFVLAQNITRLLAPSGVLYVSVPFAWKHHGFPSDYWRFTPEGVEKLFAGIAFDERFDHGATSAAGEVFPLDHEMGRLPLRSPWRLFVLRLASLLGAFRRLARYRYVLPPTMVNRVGRRRKSEGDC